MIETSQISVSWYHAWVPCLNLSSLDSKQLLSIAKLGYHRPIMYSLTLHLRHGKAM